MAAAAQRKTKLLPIGVFDSGTGGLTVLEQLLLVDVMNNTTGELKSDGIPDLQAEAFQYLADQANMPYGNYAAVQKTDLLREQIAENMQFFLSKNRKLPVKIIVLACNTATAYALDSIKKSFTANGVQIPVLGVIEAGAKAALQHQKLQPGTIGIFATAGTVASKGYPTILQQMAASEGVTSKLFFVEQGGVGLAESIDKDASFISDTATKIRLQYKGPALAHAQLPIQDSLLKVYHFDTSRNALLCEYNDGLQCVNMQLNSAENYTKFHLVTMLEKLRLQNDTPPLTSLVLACTHYPYMRTTIEQTLAFLYNYQENNIYRYRHVMMPSIAIIDPAVETAKQCVFLLQKNQLLQNRGSVAPSHTFYMKVPASNIPSELVQADGWLQYNYKYGRQVGDANYLTIVPFSKKYISLETRNRIEAALPKVASIVTYND
ncbi:MAG: Asp/Glu/hydantoin racemase [Bacteroidetes bacterium]|nr:MAG: Asp/Glu/hydantoin racemase [Bacteroidota bacterium]TAE72883.1 MAG: Asp/Glu/hydantoin racemase [Bacteroidota bacterium]TAF94023.1 MAG: Asp/Glu/hydantoin racemase [Bacteroidota bacterium]